MRYYESYWDEKQSRGWYEHVINVRPNTLIEVLKKFEKVIDWIFDNIEKPLRHARWHICTDQHFVIKTRFRYERDFIIYSLRWNE